MYKVLIIGAGAQGGACASILSQRKNISNILLMDIDLDLAQKTKDKIGSDKVFAAKIDAADGIQIEKVARDIDIIFNFALIRLNATIMEAALKTETNYVDTAFDSHLWKQSLESKQLTYDRRFKETDLFALIGCGHTPGVSNVLAKHACDYLDQVEAVNIIYGKKRLNESGGIVTGWNPGWSPEVALADYAKEPVVFENGNYRFCDPFSGVEEYAFSEPIGRLMIANHAHEGTVSLPFFIGKGIKKCTFKFPLDFTAGALVKMGFGSSEPLDVKELKIAPIDMLMKLVPRPADTFLSEDEQSIEETSKLVSEMVINIEGMKDGEAMNVQITRPGPTYEDQLQFCGKLGTSLINVALPSVVGAMLCLENDRLRGVIAPECFDPITFLKRYAQIGVPVRFKRICTTEVAFE